MQDKVNIWAHKKPWQIGASGVVGPPCHPIKKAFK
jgi:hypothetical protein